MALSPTANQSARPNPAYSNAQHATESHRGSPQSGGDRGGLKTFLAGKGIPTSGGTAKPGAAYLTDRHNDQGSKRLYLGKAYENAQHPNFTKVKGNSEGRAEIPSKTESSTVKKAAQSRISRANEGKGHEGRTPVEFAGQPFRRSHGAFGPVEKRDKASNEYESARKF